MTLALGIGATTSLYSLVDAGVLHPLPYRDADRLLSVHQLDERFGASPFAPPYLHDLRERVTEVESLAGFSARRGSIRCGRCAASSVLS